MANVPMDKGILHKWLKAGFIEKNILKPTEAGTPQGGICSPVLGVRSKAAMAPKAAPTKKPARKL